MFCDVSGSKPAPYTCVGTGRAQTHSEDLGGDDFFWGGKYTHFSYSCAGTV